MSETASPLKRLVIKNTGEITEGEITDLFGLTGALVGSSRVKISAVGDVRNASIDIPDASVKEVLKLSGVKFKGRDLVVEVAHSGTHDEQPNDATGEGSSTAQPEGTPEGNPAEDSGSSTDNDIIFMILDVRNHPDLNFPMVDETEVCDALLQKHASDPHLAIKAGWGSRLGTFVVESTDILPYVNTSLNIRGHDIALRPVCKQPQRQQTGQHQPRNDFDPDAIKVRIFDAFEVRYRTITSGAFDEAFIKMGVDVVKPTLPERCRNRREMLNTHRYVIVKPLDENGNRIDMGSHINVDGRTFKISYPGKQHFCSLCQKKHGKDCAMRVRFEALRNLRKGLTSERKVYSDSTLRLTNQLALSTDVACMSGGGIGQLCNLIPLDTHVHKEVIINAGNNELKTECPKEFVFEVDRAAKKLEKLATSIPVTVVVPPIWEDVPNVAGRSQFLRETLAKIDTITVIPLGEVELDETNHPTQRGTLSIIDQIDSLKKIILEDCRGDATLPVKYRQVQSVFKAGCRGCDSLDYTPSLCATCRQDAQETDTSILTGMIDARMNILYPPMDVEMKENKDANKRTASDVHDENLDPASKLVKSN